MTLEYRPKKITVNSFAVSNVSPRLPETHTYTMEIAFSEVVNAAEKTLTIFLSINLYLEPEKKSKVMSVQIETNFIIINFDDLVSRRELPVLLTTQLLGIAVSTARGILLVKCADTAYASFILPIINPTELYNAFENSVDRVIEKAKNNSAIGNIDGALALYNQALGLDETNIEALYNIALIQNRKGDYEVALKNISKFIQLNPNYDDAFYMRAGIYYCLDRWEAALEDLNKCLDLNPNKSEALSIKANIYKLQKRYQEAILEAEKGISLNPEFGLAYGILAEIYGEQGRKDLFYEYLEKALERGLSLDHNVNDAAYIKYRKDPRFKKLIKKYK